MHSAALTTLLGLYPSMDLSNVEFKVLDVDLNPT